MSLAPPDRRLSRGAGGALLKTLLFTVVVPGTVAVIVPRWLLASEGREQLALGLLRLVGATLSILGAVVYLRCAWDFVVAGRGTPAPIDPPKTLVARGLYRWVRNPMYLGVLAVLLGEALFFGSERLLAYAAATGLGFHAVVLLCEEPTLRGKFGESYGRYCDRVPRWIPRRPR